MVEFVYPLRVAFEIHPALKTQLLDLQPSRQRRSVHRYLSNPACDVQSLSHRFHWVPTLTHPHFTHNYCHSLSLSFHITPRIPLPSSSSPAALEIHRGIDRKTSPVSRWTLGGMYITDQRFCCLLSPTDSNAAFGLVCVHACISESDVLRDREPASLLPLPVLWPSVLGNRVVSVIKWNCLQTHLCVYSSGISNGKKKPEKSWRSC